MVKKKENVENTNFGRSRSSTLSRPSSSIIHLTSNIYNNNNNIKKSYQTSQGNLNLTIPNLSSPNTSPPASEVTKATQKRSFSQLSVLVEQQRTGVKF
jgi:hypothetical protein